MGVPVQDGRLAVKHILRVQPFVLPDTFYTQSGNGRSSLEFASRRNPSAVFPAGDTDEVGKK